MTTGATRVISFGIGGVLIVFMTARLTAIISFRIGGVIVVFMTARSSAMGNCGRKGVIIGRRVNTGVEDTPVFWKSPRTTTVHGATLTTDEKVSSIHDGDEGGEESMGKN